MWYVCTIKYYSTIKKNEILPFAITWMDLEGLMKSIWQWKTNTLCVCVRVRAHAHVLSHSVVSDSLWPPWTIGCQAPLFMKFSRQEYWSMLPFPTPGNLPNAGIKPSSLACSALAGRLFTTALPRKPNTIYYHLYVKSKKVKQMNEYNKTEQTYRYREQTSGYQWEERAR